MRWPLSTLRIPAVCLLLACGAVPAQAAWRSYHGLPTGYWTWQLRGDDEARVAMAARFLATSGDPAALPALVAGFRQPHQPSTQRALGIALQQWGPAAEAQVQGFVQDLGQGLADPDEDRRGRAVARLGGLGPAARSAIPALVRLYDGEPVDWVRTTVIESLGQIDPDDPAVVAVLRRGLTDEGLPLAREAAIAWARTDPRRVVDPAYLAALQDRRLFAQVMEGLSQTVGPPADVAAAAVLARVEPNFGLKDQQDIWNFRAGVMFGSMDFKRALAPRLLPLRRHQDPRWRIAALEVLVTLRCLPGVVEAIGDSLDDPDEAVRYAALWALRDLGEDGRAVVPALVRRLEDPTDHLRFLAADCLGGIGPAAQPAVPALLDLFRRTPDGRVRIARTLALLGGPAVREALPLLIAELARRLGDPEDCVDLAVTLSRFGAEARDAVPLLTALLANANTDIRRTALTALGTTGSAALPSAAAITARLGDAAAEPEERLAAAVALGRIGAADQDAVAALTQAQKADCPYLRLVATALLVRLGVPGAVPPVPAALPVQGKFALRAVAAADGLLDMLPQPGPVIIAFLAPLLENPEADSACAYFGEEALAVLTRLGPAARPVLPVIMRYALTTHPTARGEELLRLNPGLRVLVALGPDLALATLVESRGDPEMPYWGALQEGFLPFGARAVGPLLEVFKDEEFRPYAAEALGLLGPAARAAVPALRPLARSADPAVRAAAVRALLQIDPASAPPLR